MERWQLLWLVGIGIGAILGLLVARKSHRTLPITGGSMGHVFHYIACLLIMANAPTALLVTIFLGYGGFLTRLLTALPLVFGNLAVAAVCLIGYAMSEKSPPAHD
jgi:hypothetical protein